MRSIHDNLQAVRERIARAAAAVGRDPRSVALLAVSKTHSASLVEQALDAGQKAFGENYVQEALEKMEALSGSIGEEHARALEWHLIGPLQSNKTRIVAARFGWVHSLDGEKVARRLSEQRSAGISPLNVLIQVNVSCEASKGGVAPGEAFRLAGAVSSLPRIKLRGLMAIPEPTADVALQRAGFSRVKSIFQGLRDQGLEIDTLSMGMSDDMEAAIAEGATLVRVGTAIFGARQKIRPAA